MKRKIASAVALLLVALMLMGLVATVVLPHVYAVTSEDLNDELSELQSNREKLEKRLTEIEDKRDSELEKKEILDQQIDSLQQQVNLEQQKLDVLDEELDQANAKLDEATETYNQAYADSKERIRVSYENGSVSYLQIILSAKSVTDFIMRLEIVSEIMAHDKALLAQLKESREQIEQSKQTIAASQKEQQATTDSLKTQRSQLTSKRNASEKLVDSFSSKSDEMQDQLAELDRQEDALRDEIRRKIQEENQNNSFANVPVSSEFAYPLDTKWHIITSPFGYRTHPTTGVYKLHSGTDIAGSGIYGAPIYASKSGTVTTAGYHTAYGNYVVINHGDGTATLYAHQSSLATSAGAVVRQGQVIGYVGDSGYVTGPHLHFEILINGEYVDPVPYLSSYVNFIYY